MAAALALSLAAAVSASAQQVALSVAGGAALGMGRLGSAFPHGPGAALGIRLRPGGWPVAFEVEGSWVRLGAGNDPLIPDDAAVELLAASAGAVVDIPVSVGSRYRPYLTANLGVYRQHAIDRLGLAFTAAGAAAGGGIDVRLGRVWLFAEARYRHIWREGHDQALVPLLLGIRVAGR